MARTKKLKSMARYGVGYGKTVKERALAIELKQKRKQKCPYCKKLGVKRLSKGIWLCKKCHKKFASHTFYLG